MINELNDLEKINEYYEGLMYDSSKKQITGTISINKKFNDEVIQKEYEILVDLSNSHIPYVYDCKKIIKKTYPHMYVDRRLCLATDMEQYMFLNENKSICLWIKKYVETFFLSYEYHERYGVYPFGEYSHGLKGALEFYTEYFNMNNISETRIKDVLNYIFLRRYRGHDFCPCGSLKKVRNCHKELIFRAKDDKYFEYLRNCYIKGVKNEE